MSLKNRVEALERTAARRTAGRFVVITDPHDFPDAAPGDIKFWVPCDAWYLIVPADLGPDPDPIRALSGDQREFLEPDDRVVMIGEFALPAGGTQTIVRNALTQRPWAEVLMKHGGWRC